MIILYLILGIFIATIGAIPLGAVNLVVINASIKENIKKASSITLAAGIGEIVLAFFALHCSMELSDFFRENQWIQILFITTFFIVGIYFMSLAYNNNHQNRLQSPIKLSKSKFLTGFSLAVLNPPVIIYWILAISLTNKYIFTLTAQNPLSSLLLFFLGIYVGKIGTLYFYSKWGSKMAQKQEGSKTKFHRITGVALILISVFQSIKFVVE